MRKEEIVRNFTYHQPTSDQAALYDLLMRNAKTFAFIIKDYTYECPEQTIALRKLEECVMYACATIARDPIPEKK